MLRSGKARLAALVATGALSLAIAGPAVGAQNQAGDSLVNVQLGDIVAQLPIGIAANVCDVSANVLAAQNKLGPATCEAVTTPTAG